MIDFTGKYKKMYEELKTEHVDILHKFKNLASKPNDKDYITIDKFDIEDIEFIKKLAVISESKEVLFMLYDLKQQCVDNMVKGSVEVNLQMTGVLKGIDMVLQNLLGYKALWAKHIEESHKNG